MKHIPSTNPTACGTIVTGPEDTITKIVAEVNRIRETAEAARKAKYGKSRELADGYQPTQWPAINTRWVSEGPVGTLFRAPRPGSGVVRHNAATQRGIDACAAHDLHYVAHHPTTGYYWAVDDDQRMFYVGKRRAVRVNSRGQEIEA